MKKLAIFLALAVAVSSCNNDDNAAQPGTVNLVFANVVGTSPLNLDTQQYTNASGETYRVNELKYIISNIVFVGANNTEYTVPQAQSYFVVNQESPASLTLSIPEVEGRKYSAIRFGFGVDQSNYPLNGVNNFIPTAEENDMLWSWSAGYKFIKFEGEFDTATTTNEPFIIHVGSHGTNLDNYKEITLNLTNDITVNDNSSQIDITFDVGKIFDPGLESYSLQEKSDIQVDPVYAPIIASNVSNAFSNQ